MKSNVVISLLDGELRGQNLFFTQDNNNNNAFIYGIPFINQKSSIE